MPDKQDRYRKRKAEQGFQRVEVLVPEALAPHLKAYARALRDAHTLGLEPPLFDGMGSSAREILQPVEPSTALTEQKRELEEHDQPKPPAPAARPAREVAGATKPRPDFSKGLLDE